MVKGHVTRWTQITLQIRVSVMIDLIGTLRRLTTNIGTIFVDVAGLDGDAMRGTDDATLQATWTDARADYQDELAAANLPSDIDDTLYNTAVIHHQSDSRSRVYPQVPSSIISLTTAAVADTFGNWTRSPARALR